MLLRLILLSQPHPPSRQPRLRQIRHNEPYEDPKKQVDWFPNKKDKDTGAHKGDNKPKLSPDRLFHWLPEHGN